MSAKKKGVALIKAVQAMLLVFEEIIPMSVRRNTALVRSAERKARAALAAIGITPRKERK